MIKSYQALFFLACLICCLYQLYRISEIYFSYNTTTFVNYEKVSYISLPAITLCVNKKYVIKESYFRSIEALNLKGKQIDTHFNNLTIAQQQIDYQYGPIDNKEISPPSNIRNKKSIVARDHCCVKPQLRQTIVVLYTIRAPLLIKNLTINLLWPHYK